MNVKLGETPHPLLRPRDVAAMLSTSTENVRRLTIAMHRLWLPGNNRRFSGQYIEALGGHLGETEQPLTLDSVGSYSSQPAAADIIEHEKTAMQTALYDSLDSDGLLGIAAVAATLRVAGHTVNDWCDAARLVASQAEVKGLPGNKPRWRIAVGTLLETCVWLEPGQEHNNPLASSPEV